MCSLCCQWIALVVTARVCQVRLMSVERNQVAADPQTKPTNLGLESACWLLSSSPKIAIYHSAWKLIHILPSQEGRVTTCLANLEMLGNLTAVGELTKSQTTARELFVGMLISVLPKIDYHFEKIDLFSIIEFGRRSPWVAVKHAGTSWQMPGQ